MSGFYIAQEYSCQICIILATGCQNLGRLNRRLSEVLIYNSGNFFFLYLICNRINRSVGV